VRVVAELGLKALGGGVFVVVFALFAQTLSPKRFAGVFAAVPTVAVASLLVTTAVKGPAADAVACTGMLAGSAGMLAYALTAPTTMRRWGTLRGCVVPLGAWLALAGAALPALSAAPAAQGVVLVQHRRDGAGPVRRPRLGMDPGKVRGAGIREIALRFGFGAATSVLAGLVSRELSPLVGGAFLAFPAVLLASLTLVSGEEGERAARDDARGAVAGSIGMIAFAAVGSVCFHTVPTAAAFVLAIVAWIVVALAAYGVAWWWGMGDDEQRPVTGC
jgi:uncharacterized membrane protein (GlpM family)